MRHRKLTLYRKIALAQIQQLPHIARPIETLWDVRGVEGERGIDIPTHAGVLRIPWGQIAHTLVVESGPEEVDDDEEHRGGSP